MSWITIEPDYWVIVFLLKGKHDAFYFSGGLSRLYETKELAMAALINDYRNPKKIEDSYGDTYLSDDGSAKFVLRSLYKK